MTRPRAAVLPPETQAKRAPMKFTPMLALAATIGLGERAAERVLDDLLVHLDGLTDSLREGALPFDQNVTIDMVKELRYRRRQAMG